MQLYKELIVQYPELIEAIIQPSKVSLDSSSTQDSTSLVLLRFKSAVKTTDLEKIERWVNVRFQREDLRVITYEDKGANK